MRYVLQQAILSEGDIGRGKEGHTDGETGIGILNT